MAGVMKKSFDSPDEQRTPPNTTVDVVHLGDQDVARFTFAPGWRWSTDVAPVAGTESCQAHHVGAVLSGTLHVIHSDGTEVEVGVGDSYVFEPGHDAWVVGDAPTVLVEFESAATYAT